MGVEEPHGANEAVLRDVVYRRSLERRLAHAADPLVVDHLVADHHAPEYFGMQRRQVESMLRVMRRERRFADEHRLGRRRPVDADVVGYESILQDGKAVGYVTSGAFAHCVGRSLAAGYVPAAVARDGERFEIDILGEPCAATVRLQPLYDPEGRRLRG